uniref:Secreted protein n=1 Tax=Rodentolepis nana TaxID=102285 RepID=A0A0R3TAH7_RODNA
LARFVITIAIAFFIEWSTTLATISSGSFNSPQTVLVSDLTSTTSAWSPTTPRSHSTVLFRTHCNLKTIRHTRISRFICTSGSRV